jgi:hypothetical protein
MPINSYKCNHCTNIIKRNSSKKWIKSICIDAGYKDTRLILINKQMKKSKRIELTENTIKFLAKKAIDNGTSFKPYVEQILESLANTQVGRKKEK